MFISQAMAQTTAAASAGAETGSGMQMIFQFALIFVVLYFFMIRPQQKKMRAHELALSQIEKGTKIIVNGLIGTVVQVKDAGELLVELSKDVQVTVLRAYVSHVITDEEKKG